MHWTLHIARVILEPCGGPIGLEQLWRRAIGVHPCRPAAPPRAKDHVAQDLRRAAASEHDLMRAPEQPSPCHGVRGEIHGYPAGDRLPTRPLLALQRGRNAGTTALPDAAPRHPRDSNPKEDT